MLGLKGATSFAPFATVVAARAVPVAATFHAAIAPAPSSTQRTVSTIGKRSSSSRTGTFSTPERSPAVFGGGGATEAAATAPSFEPPPASSARPIDIGPAGPPPMSLLDKARLGFDVGIDAPDVVWYAVGALVLAAGGFALYKRSRR